MDIDEDEIDKAVLALLWLTRCDPGRAWKSHDWDALDRLHEKGMIGDPKSKANAESELLFGKLFGKKG
jgi:hypothetical protein